MSTCTCHPSDMFTVYVWQIRAIVALRCGPLCSLYNNSNNAFHKNSKNIPLCSAVVRFLAIAIAYNYFYKQLPVVCSLKMHRMRKICRFHGTSNSFSFKGLRPPDPSSGALPLDPAGGSAPRPPL